MCWQRRAHQTPSPHMVCNSVKTLETIKDRLVSFGRSLSPASRGACCIPSSVSVFTFNRQLCLSPHRGSSRHFLQRASRGQFKCDCSTLPLQGAQMDSLGVVLADTVCKRGFPLTSPPWQHPVCDCEEGTRNSGTFSSLFGSRSESDWSCKRQYKPTYKC